MQWHQQLIIMQKMAYCIDRSAKCDFHVDGIMLVFYLGLPHIRVCIYIHMYAHTHICIAAHIPFGVPVFTAKF